MEHNAAENVEVGNPGEDAGDEHMEGAPGDVDDDSDANSETVQIPETDFSAGAAYISDTEEDAPLPIPVGMLQVIAETLLAPVHIPVLSPHHVFAVPDQIIDIHTDERGWNNVFGFICCLNENIKGLNFASIYFAPPAVKTILRVLVITRESIYNFLPEEPAENRNEEMHHRFVLWNQHLRANNQLIRTIVGIDATEDCVNEVLFYFGMSFGSVENFSYGPHHETNFIIFLYCLARIGILVPNDYHILVAKVFVVYRDVVDFLHQVFDIKHSFLSNMGAPKSSEILTYAFGAAELIGRHDIFPTQDMHSRQILSQHAAFSFLFQRLDHVTRGGKIEVEEWFLVGSEENDWAVINRNLLGFCHRLFIGEYRFAKKFKAGSIIKWWPVA